MDEEKRSAGRGWLPRFSLLNVLLVMALVSSVITNYRLYREVMPLRMDVRRLRDEVGELTVTDAAKLHAIQVNTGDKLRWKWRVWIPEGLVYVVRNQGGRVPPEGFPSDGGSIFLREPGEHVIEYRIGQDQSGEWTGQLKTRGASTGNDLQPWVNWPDRVATGGGVPMQTTSFEPGSRIELIRYQVTQGYASGKADDPVEGFLIWLEPGK